MTLKYIYENILFNGLVQFFPLYPPQECSEVLWEESVRVVVSLLL